MNIEPQAPISSSYDAILDTTKTIYNEEADRFKQAESKTNITLAFTGVLLGAYLTYLGKFEPVSDATGYLVYTYVFKFVIFLCLTTSVSFFLSSVKTGKFDQIDLEKIVDTRLAQQKDTQVKISIAATYRDVIELNKSKIEKKMSRYSIGLIITFIGFLLFAIHIIVEEVIKIVG